MTTLRQENEGNHPNATGILLRGILFIWFLLPLSVSAQSGLRYYTSSIDGSSQPYAVYVPYFYNQPDTAYPVIFIGHGFGGGRIDTSFSSFQQDFADTHHFLLVKVHGRGDTFYDGVGEVDFFDVLVEVKKQYQIDETRIYFEGSSMGATGAYRLGIRHPHIFAAVGGANGWAD